VITSSVLFCLSLFRAICFSLTLVCLFVTAPQCQPEHITQPALRRHPPTAQSSPRQTTWSARPSPSRCSCSSDAIDLALAVTKVPPPHDNDGVLLAEVRCTWARLAATALFIELLTTVLAVTERPIMVKPAKRNLSINTNHRKHSTASIFFYLSSASLKMN
jgi:hypothetical protein